MNYNRFTNLEIKVGLFDGINAAASRTYDMKDVMRAFDDNPESLAGIEMRCGCGGCDGSPCCWCDF